MGLLTHAKVNYHLPRKRTLVAQLMQVTHGLKQTDFGFFLLLGISVRFWLEYHVRGITFII